jgi:type II secretory ATPase GspE/PulE/Tfp pilus assembly ATPase PilB-like protein
MGIDMGRTVGHQAGKQRPIAQDVVAIVNDVLAQAIAAGASDVHFEPTAGDLTVKFRLDGLLDEMERLPKILAEKVITRLKVMGGLLTYRNDIPQEGRIATAASTGAGRVLDLRLAVFPTIHGQRAVVRVFYEEPALAELDKLGLPPGILARLKQIAAGCQGVLLLTGPAGSGKSTTLAALLRYMVASQGGRSIVALEDPVERHIQGVTQVQIPPQGEMDFPRALRSLLRQDPEVLMIGEIRDAETARIVVEAGLTGHLLLSTLHSGTPAGALLRLLEMGVEPYQVTSAIGAVVSQRLPRMLCQRCRTRDSAGAWRAAGCGECFNSGYRGRTLLAEMVQLDADLRKAVLAKTDLEEMEAMLGRRGHMTLAHNGRRLLAEGVTTQAELDRVCGTGSS